MIEIKVPDMRQLGDRLKRMVGVKLDAAKRAGDAELRRHKVPRSELQSLPEADQLLLKAMGRVQDPESEAAAEAKKKAGGAVRNAIKKLFGK